VVRQWSGGGKYFLDSEGKVRENKKIGAIRCQIFRIKYTKFDFCWGSAPDPTEGAYSAPPEPLASFNIAPEITFHSYYKP